METATVQIASGRPSISGRASIMEIAIETTATLMKTGEHAQAQGVIMKASKSTKPDKAKNL